MKAQIDCFGARLTSDDPLYTYAGVRPLPFTNEQDEQSITRRHFIREHPRLSNLFSIVGGKLTTYRSLAEECVDLVFRKLGKRLIPCTTASPLPGAVDLDLFGLPQLSANVGERLLRVYGSRANEIIQLGERDPALLQPFNKQGNALAAEVVFAFENDGD